jgi:hypothetical protein
MSLTPRRSVRLGSARLLSLRVVGTGVWLTGGLWLVFHHFVMTQGEFGPQSSPLEPWWMKLHGAFAWAVVWLFGVLWATHISVAWPIKRRRLSGGTLTAVLIWLVVTGYLLYYIGSDTARSVVSVLHWSVGVVCPVLYWLHRARRRAKPGSGAVCSARSREAANSYSQNSKQAGFRQDFLAGYSGTGTSGR